MPKADHGPPVDDAPAPLTRFPRQRRVPQTTDPVYTVSGARDHYRSLARTQNTMDTVPVAENFFAEARNYPAHETRYVGTRSMSRAR